MTSPSNTPPHPPIASREAWLRARSELLSAEKQATRMRDAVGAQRRRLPMVALHKDYVFDGPDGPCRLVDLFERRRQLIVYHFMFDPAWERGCMGCTGLVNGLGDVSMLAQRDTTLALVSRAPLAKLLAYKAEQGWTLPWLSSFNNDFNYDFHVTLDPSRGPVSYNYRGEAEMLQAGATRVPEGECHGMSVFFRVDDAVFHTYSTYARGCEGVTDAYHLLDLTPYGRQEDWEDSPAGWPQRPTYG
jgi:predicted dithiol-disulfide oxidoreductase (DUF899 family)